MKIENMMRARDDVTGAIDADAATLMITPRSVDMPLRRLRHAMPQNKNRER